MSIYVLQMMEVVSTREVPLRCLHCMIYDVMSSENDPAVVLTVASIHAFLGILISIVRPVNRLSANVRNFAYQFPRSLAT